MKKYTAIFLLLVFLIPALSFAEDKTMSKCKDIKIVLQHKTLAIESTMIWSPVDEEGNKIILSEEDLTKLVQERLKFEDYFIKECIRLED